MGLDTIIPCDGVAHAFREHNHIKEPPRLEGLTFFKETALPVTGGNIYAGDYIQVFKTYSYKTPSGLLVEYSTFDYEGGTQWPDLYGIEKGQSKLPLLRENRGKVSKVLGEVLTFARDQYRDRRKWSPEMIDNLINTSMARASDSFLAVRDPESGKIVASMSFARSFYQRYMLKNNGNSAVKYADLFVNSELKSHHPELARHWSKVFRNHHQDDWAGKDFRALWEGLHPRQLPLDYSNNDGRLERRKTKPIAWTKSEDGSFSVGFTAGELIEPTFFAVDKNTSAEANVEIYRAVIGLMEDPVYTDQFNRENRFFYTYNDRPRLYTRMGFEETGNTFESSGTVWHELKASPRQLLESLDLANLQGDQSLPGRVKELLDALQTSSEHGSPASPE